MKKRFVLIASILLLLFALLWNACIHLVLLKADNAAIENIHRPDMADKLWISILITFAIVLLYTLSYLKWRKTGGLKEIMKHSLFFAVLIIVVVDLNQYVQYAIPFSLIIKWALFGMAEFFLYGLILHFLYKKLFPSK